LVDDLRDSKEAETSRILKKIVVWVACGFALVVDDLSCCCHEFDIWGESLFPVVFVFENGCADIFWVNGE